jgi:hypothetical protein
MGARETDLLLMAMTGCRAYSGSHGVERKPKSSKFLVLIYIFPVFVANLQMQQCALISKQTIQSSTKEGTFTPPNDEKTN